MSGRELCNWPRSQGAKGRGSLTALSECLLSEEQNKLLVCPTYVSLGEVTRRCCCLIMARSSRLCCWVVELHFSNSWCLPVK